MKFLVNFIEEILLDDGVHHHGDEEIEEDSWHVLEPSGVEGEVLEHSGHGLHVGGGVVLHHDEDRCQGGGDLEHQPDHEDHGDTRHDVRVVLDDELMAEVGRVLGLLLHHVVAGYCHLLAALPHSLGTSAGLSWQWPTVPLCC